jgi:outer membrane lipoprotein-sorting protein
MRSAFALTAILFALPARAGELTPREILDRVDDTWRGDSGRGKMRMQVVTEHWNRELTIEFWSQGKEKSLMRILAPLKEKGTATLMVDDNIWNYLPKVKRTIKVPSSMMGGSWMGSHFTNDDLVKDSRMADDYDFEVTFKGRRDGKEIVELTCIPKQDAAVVWGKVVVVAQTNHWIPLEMKYFDEDLDLARVMTFSDVKRIGGRFVPVRATMVPSDKPAESTTVIYDEIEFDVKLDPSLFSKRRLQR